MSRSLDVVGTLVPAAYLKFDALEQSLVNKKFKTWLCPFRPNFGRVAEQKA